MDILYALALGGLALKVLEKVIAIRNSGRAITLRGYLTESRYRLALSVCATVLVFTALHDIGQLNGASALAAGYCGESAARFLTQRFKIGAYL